jgi:hypothetical protein
VDLFHALWDIIEKRRCFCVIRCHFKWHEFITWTVVFWHAASTANYMMLVTKKIHYKVRMS